MYVYNCIFEANFHKINQNCGNSRNLLVPGILLWKFPLIIRFNGNLSGRESRHFEEISNPKNLLVEGFQLFSWGPQRLLILVQSSPLGEHITTCSPLSCSLIIPKASPSLRSSSDSLAPFSNTQWSRYLHQFSWCTLTSTTPLNSVCSLKEEH